jgi:hypothetical protein
MGRKGVSKRKPKRSIPPLGANVSGASSGRSGENSPVQLLVKNNADKANRGSVNPFTGANNKNRRGR